MRIPSNADAFEVLCLQAADEGRGDALFGDSLPRARKALRPFMVGDKFPSVYLEFPLAGAPFLDVTVLYDSFEKGAVIDSPSLEGTEAMCDWFAETCSDIEGVCFGFEVDTKNSDIPAAAVHFQPRAKSEYVKPFCDALGESDRAKLYLDLAQRMPSGWPLSFFGMFRGRNSSPLRVCGYISEPERRECASSITHLASVFDEIGFVAYDTPMLEQISQLMEASDEAVDFQFDVYPDGHLGDIFAIDVQFGIEQPERVRESFDSGVAHRVMKLLEDWGAADERWKLAGDAAFARAVPVKLDDKETGRYSFTLMPQWVKARWVAGTLQNSKLYHYANASLMES